jgi:hypothetical protein
MIAPPASSGCPNLLKAVSRTEQTSPAMADISAASSILLTARHGAPGRASSANGLPSTATWSMRACIVCSPIYCNTIR